MADRYPKNDQRSGSHKEYHSKICRTKMLRAIFAVGFLLACASNAFVIPKSNHQSPRAGGRSNIDVIDPTFASSDVVVDHLLNPLQELVSITVKEAGANSARGEFWFYSAAGSGAGGIGVAQLPKFFQWINASRSLDGFGPTAGGTKLNAGIASFVYPTLYEKDVSKIIQKLPSAETIVLKGKSEGYMASKGYIVREDFELALQGCNPLAIRAAFDALTTGTGDALSPIRFQENLDRYKGSTDAFLQDLQAAAFTKISAFVALSFLLFILFFAIFDAGMRGWF